MNAPPYLFWDASALVKKYIDEAGSETVDALFSWSEPVRMISTLLSFAETAAILRRRFNHGVIDLREFNVGRMLLEQEILLEPEFELLSPLGQRHTRRSGVTDQHNLNTSDAAILACFLQRVRLRAPAGMPILVASDRRLLRGCGRGSSDARSTSDPTG